MNHNISSSSDSELQKLFREYILERKKLKGDETSRIELYFEIYFINMNSKPKLNFILRPEILRLQH